LGRCAPSPLLAVLDQPPGMGERLVKGASPTWRSEMTRNMKEIFAVVKRNNGKTHWTRIGVAFENSDVMRSSS
jgi:hypothetical protein